jgi:hypothetical protein
LQLVITIDKPGQRNNMIVRLPCPSNGDFAITWFRGGAEAWRAAAWDALGAGRIT